MKGCALSHREATDWKGGTPWEKYGKTTPLKNIQNTATQEKYGKILAPLVSHRLEGVNTPEKFCKKAPLKEKTKGNKYKNGICVGSQGSYTPPKIDQLITTQKK